MSIEKNRTTSEIGIIPSDWCFKKLGDLFEITSSKRVYQREWKSIGIPFYRARELAVLSETGTVNNELFIDEELFDAYRVEYGVPQVGDLLVTGVGTLGKMYVVSDERKLYFKDGNIIWFKNFGKVNPFFLKQLFLTNTIIKQIEDGSAGTTVGTYTITGAKKTIIPYPPLPEQEAIAEVFSDLDALIAAQEELIVKKRLIKQGVMHELLTGKRRLSGFEEEWKEVKLFDCGTVIMGQSPPGNSYNFEGKGLPLLNGAADLRENEILVNQYTTMPTKVCQKGDLLFCIRATIGNLHIADREYCLGRGVAALRVSSQFNQEFLSIQLQGQFGYMREQSEGGVIKGLKKEELLNLKIKIPNSNDEQSVIAEVIGNLSLELTLLDKLLSKFWAIKQGMMQELLTGKIRLI